MGAGAAIGLIGLVFVMPQATQALRFASAASGALAILVLILALGRRSAFAPERVLLAGIAVAAFFNAIAAAAVATGNPHVVVLRLWMAGSTDLMRPGQAMLACITAVVMIGIVPFGARWLEILPLGGEAGRSLGLGLTRSRAAILLLVGALTTGATLIVGPLGFVGLMAPHMARMLGLRRPMGHIAGAAALGGLIMVVADWVGRNALFPYQLPVGLLAALVGGPYFMWLMLRRAV